MKKEKIFKLQFFDLSFNYLKDGVTECVIKFDFNISHFENKFGGFANSTKKAFKGLGLTFDCDGDGHIISKGYSKCYGKDIYNRIIGERIAEAKAKRNAYRIGIRVGKILEKETRNKLIDIMRFNEQMLKCERCEKEHAYFIENKLN